MKKTVTILLLLLVSMAFHAQEKQKAIKTLTLKVKGTCGQCKKRIENAADIKGVKLAEWDVKTQELKVTYRADKVSEKQIKEAILKTGHDVGDEKAPDEAYNKLPDCCKFRDPDKIGEHN